MYILHKERTDKTKMVVDGQRHPSVEVKHFKPIDL